MTKWRVCMLTILACQLTITVASAADMYASHTIPVTKWINVTNSKPITDGSQVCGSTIQNECGTLDYYKCNEWGHGSPSAYNVSARFISATEYGSATASYWINTYECKGDCVAVCNPGGNPGGGGTDEPCNWCSPLVVDLGRNGFDLTAAEAGVSFDIDADGALDVIAWTADTADDAFIALDRNGNGVIDSGAELFGDSTAQPATGQPNGFSALAVFDLIGNGGNADGILGHEDAVWSRLMLWVDASHDGESQSDELRPIAASGVGLILLDYKESQRRDRYGNRFYYRSTAVAEPASRKLDVVDVFFIRQ